MRGVLRRSNASQGEPQLARFLFDGLLERSGQLLFDDNLNKDGFTEWETFGVCHLPGAGIFTNFRWRFEINRDINFLPDCNQSA